MEAFHRSAIRLLALLLTVLLTEIALGAGQSVTAVSSRPCRVVNVTQGKHFPPDSGGALAAAIVAANADDQLTITGICTGTYTLDQHIALTGVATQQSRITWSFIRAPSDSNGCVATPFFSERSG